jgi:hypothetical protein
MRGGIVHSDAMLVQVDVIFNPRVEPSIYERLKHEDLFIKQGACPFKGHAHSRICVVAHRAICHSSIMTTYLITITYYDTVNGMVMPNICTVHGPSDQSRNHRESEFRGDEFDEVFRSYVKIVRSH